MPAGAEELELALADGVRFLELAAPVEQELRKGRGVGNALHHRGRTPENVPGGVHILQIGAEGGAAILLRLPAPGGQPGSGAAERTGGGG